MHLTRRSLAASAAAAISLLALNAGVALAEAAAGDAEMARKLMAAVPSHGEKALGRADAPVVMIEYASATCPHCAEFHNNVWPAIKRDYVDTGKVRFIFREFPLDQRALAAFMLVRCVPDDMYFATIDKMFERQKVWNGDRARTELFAIMRESGLPETDADACLKKEDLAKAIFETGRIANQDFGVKGTPTFFVNGKLVEGHEDPAAVSKAIEAAMAN